MDGRSATGNTELIAKIISDFSPVVPPVICQANQAGVCALWLGMTQFLCKVGNCSEYIYTKSRDWLKWILARLYTTDSLPSETLRVFIVHL